MLRPSLATQEDDTLLASKLLVLVDSSESMNLTDEIDGMSRWDHARRILANPDVAEAVKDLALKHKIELVYYQGAEGIAVYPLVKRPAARPPATAPTSASGCTIFGSCIMVRTVCMV